MNCYQLKTVNLGSGIETLSSQIFKNCYSLDKIEFPSSIKNIEKYAFSVCSSLKSINLSECSILSIKDFSFESCYSLGEIVFPQDVETLGTHSFSSTEITELNLPPTISSIGTSCFFNCTLLKTFTIPKDSQLETFDSGVFEQCSNFTSINNECDKFQIINEALYNKDLTHFIILPPNSPVKYISLPENLTSIRSKAFLGCKHIEVVTIPSGSVETIGQNAFEGCKNLQYINIPNSITTIGQDAFLGCKNLHCGLIIENRTQEYLDMLKSVAKLQNRHILPCINQCTESIIFSAHYKVFSFCIILGSM